MDTHLAALKLFLDDLDVRTDISTLADRKRVQKAVYLGQAAGANLGYGFSWYILGPYSPSLTRDYFELAEKREEYDTAVAGYALHSGLRNRLDSVRMLLDDGDRLNSKLALEDWLELCASIDYQVRAVGRGLEETKQFLAEHPGKFHLADYFDEAVQALEQSGILQLG